MKTAFLIIFGFCMFIQKSQAASDPVTAHYRLNTSGAYQQKAVDRGAGGTSRMSGFGYGVGIERVVPAARTKTSFMLGFESSQLENSLNTAVLSESLQDTLYYLGARFYANYLFIGAKVIAGDKTLAIRSAASLLKEKFIEYGIDGEIGTDLRLFAGLHLLPTLRYRSSVLEPKDSAKAEMRSVETSASLSLSYEF